VLASSLEIFLNLIKSYINQNKRNGIYVIIKSGLLLKIGKAIQIIKHTVKDIMLLILRLNLFFKKKFNNLVTIVTNKKLPIIDPIKCPVSKASFMVITF